jgi:transposase-like protein
MSRQERQRENGHDRQSGDGDQPALRLMRKLLKKCAFVPNRLVTDDLWSYAAAAHALEYRRRYCPKMG